MADRGFDHMQALGDDEDLRLQCADRRLVNAVGLRRQRLYETGSVGDIAKAVGASERELSGLFKEYLHLPPAEYWRQFRLKAAY